RAIAALGDDLLDDAELVEPGVARGGQINLSHPAPRHRLEQDVLAKSARIGPGHHQRSGDRRTSLARREPKSLRCATDGPDLRVTPGPPGGTDEPGDQQRAAHGHEKDGPAPARSSIPERRAARAFSESLSGARVAHLTGDRPRP